MVGLGAVPRAAWSGLKGLGGGLLDLLVPQTCVACGEWLTTGAGAACARCDGEMRAGFAEEYCRRCGRTLPTVAIHEGGCARCRTEPFWNVAGVARVGRYTPVTRQALLALKHRGDERCAAYFAELLEAALRDCGWVGQIDALVPVPMHWLRRWQRPCDHAHLLAEALAERLGLPVVRLVRRAKHTPSQTGMSSKTQRFENVRGCFGPPGWWWRLTRGGRCVPTLAGRTVCIVDNLLVAGATVHEVSKVLRRAGARRIYALVVARPPAPGDPPAGTFPTSGGP